jgi:hypothetical protein
MKLQKRVITYEDVSIDANELVSLKEAAAMLDTTVTDMELAIAKDAFTVIIDTYTNRRYLLRSEIEEGRALRARNLAAVEEVEKALNTIFKGATP